MWLEVHIPGRGNAREDGGGCGLINLGMLDGRGMGRMQKYEHLISRTTISYNVLHSDALKVSLLLRVVYYSTNSRHI